MIHSKLVLVAGPALFVLLAVCGNGCGRSSQGDYRRYVPNTGPARQALETALTAWQRGEPAGRISAASPAIEVVDTKRPKGQKLQKYEILKEESNDGPRWFSVRLTFDSPARQEDVRYAVVGNDPIWVMRDADYAQAESM